MLHEVIDTYLEDISNQKFGSAVQLPQTYFGSTTVLGTNNLTNEGIEIQEIRTESHVLPIIYGDAAFPMSDFVTVDEAFDQHEENQYFLGPPLSEVGANMLNLPRGSKACIQFHPAVRDQLIQNRKSHLTKLISLQEQMPDALRSFEQGSHEFITHFEETPQKPLPKEPYVGFRVTGPLTSRWKTNGARNIQSSGFKHEVVYAASLLQYSSIMHAFNEATDIAITKLESDSVWLEANGETRFADHVIDLAMFYEEKVKPVIEEYNAVANYELSNLASKLPPSEGNRIRSYAPRIQEEYKQRTTYLNEEITFRTQ